VGRKKRARRRVSACDESFDMASTETDGSGLTVRRKNWPELGAQVTCRPKKKKIESADWSTSEEEREEAKKENERRPFGCEQLSRLECPFPG